MHENRRSVGLELLLFPRTDDGKNARLISEHVLRKQNRVAQNERRRDRK